MVILIALTGVLSAGAIWSKASFSPKLALDLAGGTQIILAPKANQGQESQITTATINQAIAIIRQRVDASGVSEAEVSSQGGRNIVVSLPGDPAEQAGAIRLVSQSAQMSFRPVLVEADGTPTPAPSSTPTAGANPSPGAAPTAGATPSTGTTPSTAAKPSASTPSAPEPAASTSVPTTGSNGRAIPYLGSKVVSAPTPASTAPATPAGSIPAASRAPGDPEASNPAASPLDPSAVDPSAAAAATAATGTASDQAQITSEIAAKFQALDCSKEANRTGGVAQDPKKVLVTCSQDGSARYILGPVEVEGSHIKSASSGMGTSSQGVSTGQWVVDLSFDSTGAAQFKTVTTRLVGLQQPQNQFAIVLDGLVVSAPRTNNVITDGKAEISGSFTQDSAAELASQLKFGALPLSFQVQSSEQISALLGSEQLRSGVLAGIIGLLLVVVYSLLQYRALGLVTVISLTATGLLTYLTICLLSWTYGYRLSLAGVAGLIIAIGVTADSFIVYFERIRDEVREGRSLTAAVETGWSRARRTIVASDAINLLAACVLYLLAVGDVRGFAFTLGLTTILDLIIVILFTHPIVAILARTKFFGGGHPLSGFDAEHLGRAPVYAGRGRLRTPDQRKGKAVVTAEADAFSSDVLADAAQDAGADAPIGPQDDADFSSPDLNKAASGSASSDGLRSGVADSRSAGSRDEVSDGAPSGAASSGRMTIAQRKAAERKAQRAAAQARSADDEGDGDPRNVATSLTKES